MIILIEQVTGIQSSEEHTVSPVISMTASPNPFTSSLQVEVHSNRSMQVNIELSDMAGRSVFSSPVEKIPIGETAYSINTENLRNGVYYLCITSSRRYYQQAASNISILDTYIDRRRFNEYIR